MLACGSQSQPELTPLSVRPWYAPTAGLGSHSGLSHFLQLRTAVPESLQGIAPGHRKPL